MISISVFQLIPCICRNLSHVRGDRFNVTTNGNAGTGCSLFVSS